MSRPLDWEREGASWPHREASSFLQAGGIRWHLQIIGPDADDAPTILLLHGTGASSHSWRGVMPILGDSFRVIAPDLPGHAFTRASSAHMTLPAMAKALWRLLDAIEAAPTMLVGHSAGAAIALQMLREREATMPVVGLNPALAPFPGLGAQFFPLMAKLLFVNPLVPRIFSGMARISGDTERFLRRSTHSRINAEGVRCYNTLLRNSTHCRSALAMMANWDLEALERALADLASPVLLVHSDRDNAVPLASVRRAAEQLPNAQLEVLPNLGHLAHEEQPQKAADLIRQFHAKN